MALDGVLSRLREAARDLDAGDPRHADALAFNSAAHALAIDLQALFNGQPALRALGRPRYSRSAESVLWADWSLASEM